MSILKKILSFFRTKKPYELQGFELYPNSNKIKSMKWGNWLATSPDEESAPTLHYDKASDIYCACFDYQNEQWIKSQKGKLK